MAPPLFHRLLIANRGDVAARVARACDVLGIVPVFAVSEADREAPYTRGRETVLLGPGRAALSYLDVERVVQAAVQTHCSALHPGWGFLSENPLLATLSAQHGVTFIGPPPQVTALMGSKTRAKAAMRAAGMQVIPGSQGVLASVADAQRVAAEVGFPVLFKAENGGGGRGMRIARSAGEVETAYSEAQAEARAVASIGYVGAGTMELLLDRDPNGDVLRFMELNCRLQVEHTVSEERTGKDLVIAQIQVAAGRPLPWTQDAITMSGHVIECRINAEDPSNHFAPAPGTITAWQPPTGDGIRVDTHVEAGYVVPPFYDSLLAKLIVRGTDREAAIERMIAALSTFTVAGVPTTIPMHLAILRSTAFRTNAYDTRSIPGWPS